MKMVPIGSFAVEAGRKARSDRAPVYSVTKHQGFVLSEDYFSKQVFSRDLSGYKIVDAGTFAYATIHLDEGSLGIAPQDALISPMYTAFTVDSEMVCPRYILRLLKSPRAMQVYATLGNGSAHRRRSIPFNRLAAMEVPLPSLDEQQRIADILDKADALRSKRREAIAHLDSLGQSIFHEMFSGFSESATVPLETLAAGESGSIRTGPFGSQLLASEFTDSGVAVLGIDNTVNNRFSWKQRRFISSEKFEKLKRYVVHPGDVVITIMGTLGRCAVVPDDIPTAINTKHLCCITLDRKKAHPVFLHSYFLQHPVAARHLRQTTKGSIMGGLNMGIIKSMPVIQPPLELQTEFAQRMSIIDSLRIRYQAQLVELDNLFLSLQDRAFKGEL